MWTCPVCNQLGDTLLCPNCSFDISCDLEHYPTLSAPSTLPVSILQRKNKLEQAKKRLLRCPDCGQYAFQFDRLDNLLICLKCNHQLSLEQIQAKPKPAVSPAIAQNNPVNRSEAAQDTSITAENNRKTENQDKARNLNNLGLRHYNKQDYYWAVEYFRKAADLGNAEAQNRLGDCYFYGHGVNRDYAKAIDFYCKSARQGNADAQNNLGHCYYYGHGVEVDDSLAASYYSEAADQGHADAQNKLGYCYYRGIGVDRNLSMAKEYFKKAAAQGNKSAQKILKKLKNK